MAEFFDSLTDEHIAFIRRQHLFFVGTAGASGHVNVSPKGLDTLAVAEPNRIIWLNLTGSGNETAAHVAENQRMTIMFCSFERQPLILRVYGKATAIHPHDEQWARTSQYLPETPGARQFYDLTITLVQTSCGYAVPEFSFSRERPTLTKWAEKKDGEALRSYWSENNRQSIDGKQTFILDEAQSED